ncbi:hypothetical protein [Taibaiella koreensis]|uniref:hypothetical protein n=1 Tax=Taibaiella koreensis TaxID=1268548 RepID=UPI000E59983C|nr:hypothetical protein [Taibaiella koreensis]
MMKSIEEIKSMLVKELLRRLPGIASNTKAPDYYNELLGDTSYLLTGLLGLNLREQFSDWPSQNWMDDSLITKVALQDKKMALWGEAIWGVMNDTEQWVDPLYFEMELDESKSNYTSYTFLFSDLEYKAIPYSFFKHNRSYWQSTKRNWKYRICEGVNEQ